MTRFILILFLAATCYGREVILTDCPTSYFIPIRPQLQNPLSCVGPQHVPAFRDDPFFLYSPAPLHLPSLWYSERFTPLEQQMNWDRWELLQDQDEILTTEELLEDQEILADEPPSSELDADDLYELP